MGDDSDELVFKPARPGEYLRQDILPAIRMSIRNLAAHLDVSRQSLSELVHERRDLSVPMARRLGKAFGNGARFWVALQLQYDLWRDEQERAVDVDPIEWRRDGSTA